jgi:hypothetical protein
MAQMEHVVSPAPEAPLRGSGIVTAKSEADGGASGFGSITRVGGAAAADATGTSTGPGEVTSSATASGGLGGSTFGEPPGKGGEAIANASATSEAGANTKANAIATGGAGGNSCCRLKSPENGGAGGDAAATAKAITTGFGIAEVTAVAGTGGVSSSGGVNGASGTADAQSQASVREGLVMTIAHAPAAGVAARAETRANTQDAVALIPIAAGEAASNAILYGSANGVAAGAMSAGYGGSGETRTYSAEADFSFAVLSPEKFYLRLLDNNVGAGFDNLSLEIDLNGMTVASEATSSLLDAQAFFTDHSFYFGALAPGSQTLDLKYALTASVVGDGFGFTYETAVPEPSTWAMMALGFGGLAFVGYRARKSAAPAA